METSDFAAHTARLSTVDFPHFALRGLAASFALRLGLASSALLHEWSHLAATAALLARHPRARELLGALLSRGNLAGNIPLASWAHSLAPIGGGPLPSSLRPHVLLPEAVPACVASLSRRAGWAASVAMAAGLATFAAAAAASAAAAPDIDQLPLAPSWPLDVTVAGAAKSLAEPLAWYALGFILTAAGAVGSDFLRLGCHAAADCEAAAGPCCPSRVLWCGNFGAMICEVASSGVDALRVLHEMARISMQRGGQSGGLVHFRGGHGQKSGGSGSGAAHQQLGSIEGVLTRYSPSKRESLADGLLRVFRSALKWKPQGAGGHGLYLGHTRFATSSVPKVTESHPHIFSPERPASVYRVRPRGGGSAAGSPAGGNLEVAKSTERLGVYM